MRLQQHPVLLTLAILVAGGIAGFAIYTFGWRDDGDGTAASVRHRVYTIRPGDALRVPTTATRCVASHEGGIPNLFCSRSHRGRYQVVFWKDEVQVFDLACVTEPMAATFVVPAEMGRRDRRRQTPRSLKCP